jgi:hypothetical protein
MLSVRVEGQKYWVTHETLDRLFGVDKWRRLDPALLQNRVRHHHRAGRLILDDQHVRLASPLEEAESRLRAEKNRDEILRWGFLRVAAGLAQIADEIRALRTLTESRDIEELEAATRSARPEARHGIAAVEQRMRSAQHEGDAFDPGPAAEKLTRDNSENLVERQSTFPDDQSGAR